MKSLNLGMVAAGLLLGWGAPAWAGDSLEIAEKKIGAAWEKTHSVSAKFTMTQDLDTDKMSVHSTGKGRFAFLRKGDKQMYRLDLATDSVQVFGGQEMKSHVKSVTLDDSEFLYTLSEMAGGTAFAMKSKSKPQQWGNGKASFELLKASSTLKILADATVEGRACFVIESIPNDPQSTMTTKTHSFYAKGCGMLIKSVAYGPNGKPSQEIVYSDIKFDQAIPADRFVFEVPDGVTIRDMTDR